MDTIDDEEWEDMPIDFVPDISDEEVIKIVSELIDSDIDYEQISESI